MTTINELAGDKPKRRDKLVIMTEIFGIAKKGSLKTQIMFKANMSYAQLKQYLKLLLQKNVAKAFNLKILFILFIVKVYFLGKCCSRRGKVSGCFCKYSHLSHLLVFVDFP